MEIPVLFVGDVCLLDVPRINRGRSLGLSQIQVMVYRVLENHNYRIMYKNGSVGQRAANVSTLEKVSPAMWQPEWASLSDVRENSKKSLREAVRLYYQR